LSNLKEYQILIGHYLIDYIDSEGRLSFEVDYSDIEDLVKETYSLSISKKEINQVLGKIQKFDPVGCGYSSLEESLLIQAEELFEDVINKKRVKNLIKEIGKNTIKYENLDQEDKKLLGRLNFLPSYNNLVKEETYVRPDLVVKKQNENFVVVLNDKFLNETLYQMIANKINDLKKDTDLGIEEKNIVVGLKKREESLVEVGKVIINHQIEYIKGKGPLVPLGLSDIADECNLSKSLFLG
jgi:DNA-directed RNA polymerase specialized sigma subunit, sigma54 homolog